MNRIESGSSLGVFRTCAKKYEFQIEKKLSPKGYSTSLGYGTFIHAYTAILRAQRVSEKLTEEMAGRLVEAKAKLLSEHPDHHPQIEADCELARKVSAIWINHWSSSELSVGEPKLQWIDVEGEWGFKVPAPAGDDWTHVGARDGAVRHIEWDKLFLYELKTALSKDESSYLYRLNLDYQINSNLLALEREGRPAAGVLYDIIWKPAIRRKTNRKTMPDETLAEFHERILEEYRATPNDYFQRVLVNRTGEHIAEYETELFEQFREISDQEVRYRNPGACMQFNKICPFFELCMDPSSVEIESTFIKREKRLAELKSGD